MQFKSYREKILRNRFGNWINGYARNKKDLRLLVGDIGFGLFDDLRSEFPEVFINCGIAEQNMIGTAAGIASEEIETWVYTIIPFLLYRPYDFVRNMICHQNLNVKLVGVGGGLVYDTLGFTHFALEDLAIAKTLPNLDIFLPYDPDNAEKIFSIAANQNNPVYIRLMKGGEDNIGCFSAGDGFDIINDINDSEVSIFAYGSHVKEALKATESLNKIGITTKLVAIWNVKALQKLESCFSKKNFFYEEHFFGGIFERFSEKSDCFYNYIKYETLSNFYNRNKLLAMNNFDAESIFNSISEEQ